MQPYTFINKIYKIHALFLLSNLANFSLEVTFSIFQVLNTQQYILDILTA